MVDEPLTGKGFKELMLSAARRLDVNKEAVNSLNVFPVPDGDTGTNMCLTMAAALRELDKVRSSSIGESAKAISLGSLMGARGNSGVILSQLMRGFAKSLQDNRTATALQLAWAFQEGVETAYKAVMKPVEGTILTVAREAAKSGLQVARKGAGLVEFLNLATSRASEVLARTPDMLPVLKQAGVVDAGGMGLLYILEGALAAARGEEVAEEAGAWSASPPQATAAEALALAQATATPAKHAAAEADADIRYAYDTQLLIKGLGLAVDRIRAELEPMGDSLLVVGDTQLIKIHVHTNEPHQAIAVCLGHGEIVEASVENMRQQHEALERAHLDLASPDSVVPGKTSIQAAGAAGSRPDGFDHSRSAVSAFPGAPNQRAFLEAVGGDAEPAGGPGVVVVASGAGLEAMFRNLGADMVVSGGQTMNPSTEDMLRAIESLPQPDVLVLPNNGNILLAAKQTDELTSKTVRVVPTRSIPQGIAALVVLNRQLDAEKNQARMEQALARVRSGEITRAVRDSQYKDIAIKEGDFIGLLDDEITTVGKSAEAVLEALVSRMSQDGTEIVTVFYGEPVSDDEAVRAAERLKEIAPDHEIEIHRGGQPLYHYLVSVE